MTVERQSIHGQWSSRWAFILAATGAAVGLGNVWKFPYITGENGGGAFVLLYLACVAIIGVPIMMAEIMLGRRGRQNPANTMLTLAEESGRHKTWAGLGILGVAAGFLILTYYSVITGWAMDYMVKATRFAFHSNGPAASLAEASHHIDTLFQNLLKAPMEMVMYHTIVMLTTTLIVAQGVEKGLEKAVQFMFPLMLICLLILVGYAAKAGAFSEAVHFLFSPHFHKLSASSILSALGHAFFTLSLATGSIMMYGAYLPRDTSIAKASLFIALADTSIALIAGLAIFPIVFANHLTPGAGPGLIFQTLPVAFSQMFLGDIFAIVFFLMLVFAALTSAISLMEPVVAWSIERLHLSRRQAAWCIGFSIWFLGFGTIFSFNIWQNFKIVGFNIFELLDYLTANIMLPLGGLFIAIFAGWRMDQKAIHNELQIDRGFFYKSWRFCIRYICPTGILIIFANTLNIF